MFHQPEAPSTQRTQWHWLLLIRRTGGEENDGFETRVLGRVDVQRFEFLDLLLEDADVIHEGNDAVGRHRAGVQSGGGQQRRYVQRHRTLRRVQHEQFAPDQPQQRHLICHLRNTFKPPFSNHLVHLNSY